MRDQLGVFGTEFRDEEYFLGIHIHLPKIPVGRIIGNVVKQTVPGGDKIVNAANAIIHGVKDAKINVPSILKQSGQAAIDNTLAQIKSNITETPTGQVLQAADTATKWLVPALLGGILIFMMTRSK